MAYRDSMKVMRTREVFYQPDGQYLYTRGPNSFNSSLA